MLPYADFLKKYIASESSKYTESVSKDIMVLERFPDPKWRVCALLAPEGISYFISDKLNAGRVVQRLPTVHSFASALCDRGIYGEITVSIGDKPSFDDPCISFSSSKIYDYLIPDPYFCRSNGYAEAKKEIAKGWLPLNERKEAVFWRGATTGSINRPDGRLYTVYALNQETNAKIDVKFATSEAELKEFLATHDEDTVLGPLNQQTLRNMTADRVPFIQFMQFCWQLDLDGNSNAWDSMFKKLLLGGPVIKIGARFKQWYYERLISAGCVDWLSGPEHLKEFANNLSLDRAEALGSKGREFAINMTVKAEIQNCADGFSMKALPLYQYSPRIGDRIAKSAPLEESILMRTPGDFRSLSDNLYRHDFRQEALSVFERGIDLFPPQGSEQVSRMAHLERLKMRLAQQQD